MKPILKLMEWAQLTKVWRATKKTINRLFIAMEECALGRTIRMFERDKNYPSTDLVTSKRLVMYENFFAT
jgi:hypothetical protein